MVKFKAKISKNLFFFLRKIFLFILFLSLWGCGGQPKVEKINEKQRLQNELKNNWQKAKNLFSNSSKKKISQIVDEANFILFIDSLYIKAYKNKYPELTKQFISLNNYIITHKSKLIIKTFLSSQGKKIYDKYFYKNLALVDKFSKGIEQYLKNVENATGEIFVEELLAMTNYYKAIKDPKTFVKNAFYARFISPEMLNDAVYDLLLQINDELTANMNRFLADMEGAFLAYLKSLNDTEFLFEPKPIYTKVEKNFNISVVYYPITNLNWCIGNLISQIAKEIKKNAEVQSGDLGISLIPGIGWITGTVLDLGAMAYEKKVRNDVKNNLDKLLKEMKFCILVDLGYKKRLENFIIQYEHVKQEIFKNELLNQYISFQKKIFIPEGGEKL